MWNRQRQAAACGRPGPRARERGEGAKVDRAGWQQRGQRTLTGTRRTGERTESWVALKHLPIVMRNMETKARQKVLKSSGSRSPRNVTPTTASACGRVGARTHFVAPVANSLAAPCVLTQRATCSACDGACVLFMAERQEPRAGTGITFFALGHARAYVVGSFWKGGAANICWRG